MIGIDALIKTWDKEHIFFPSIVTKKTRNLVLIGVNEHQKRQKISKTSTKQSEFLHKMV